MTRLTLIIKNLYIPHSVSWFISAGFWKLAVLANDLQQGYFKHEWRKNQQPTTKHGYLQYIS